MRPRGLRPGLIALERLLGEMAPDRPPPRTPSTPRSSSSTSAASTSETSPCLRRRARYIGACCGVWTAVVGQSSRSMAVLGMAP